MKESETIKDRLEAAAANSRAWNHWRVVASLCAGGLVGVLL